VRRLAREKLKIKALVRPGKAGPEWNCDVEVVQGDIQDFRAMKQAVEGCEAIFHLAAKVHDSKAGPIVDLQCQLINVDGTSTVMDAAAAGGVRRVVFFSSVKAMGEGGPACLDESAVPHPVTAYGRSKLAAEQIVLQHGKQAGMHVACLRLPPVYGPGHKGNLQRMIWAIERGLFPPLPELENPRSFLHIENLLQAAMLAADTPAAGGQCYIVTDARAYTTFQLDGLIRRALGRPVPRWRVPLGVLKAAGKAGDVVSRVLPGGAPIDSATIDKLIGAAWYSSAKIAGELGYRPTASLEESVHDLLVRGEPV
jgi:nucleoside-diphosphate-sugar epimerase